MIFRLLLGFCMMLPSFSWCQPTSENTAFTYILVGDAGEHKPFTQKVMDKALEEGRNYGTESAMIFLGDNLYPVGLPPEDHPDRATMESKLVPQLVPLRDTEGKGFIIPGNHDWAKGKEEGKRNILEQQTFADNYTGKRVFYPRDGCPGPVDFNVNEDNLLILVDTQWLLMEEDVRDNSHCAYPTTEEVMAKLDELITSNQDKLITFAAHHPILTYGTHGGVFKFKQHLFPLTDIKKGLWIPLPIIGSIYPLYRKWFGNIQDATNKKYKRVMDQLVTRFEKHDRVIHVAGHEHNLQYMERNGVVYVVSGSGSKTEFVKLKGHAKYVAEKNGLALVSYLNNDEVWLTFWIYDEENPEGKMSYQEQLFTADQ